MMKVAISAAAMAALQFMVAERALTIDQRTTDIRIVSSDANSRQLKLGFKKAVVIDLPVDIKEVLVADPGTVRVIVRTMRRVYIIGAALGKTNIFFYDEDGRQIVALDVWVLEIMQPQPSELGDRSHRRPRDPASQHFLKALSLSDNQSSLQPER